MQSDDLDRAIEQSHFALSEIVRGNAEPFQVLEDGTWKLVHRHADPITARQPPESVIQR